MCICVCVYSESTQGDGFSQRNVCKVRMIVKILALIQAFDVI